VYAGFFSVLSTVPSFVKSHAHAVTLPVEPSVNWTASGKFPLVGVAVKATTGAGLKEVTMMYPVFVSLSLPPAFVAVRFTE